MTSSCGSRITTGTLSFRFPFNAKKKINRVINMNCKFLFDVNLFFNSSSDTESMEDNTSIEVLNTAKETLLQGLSEENQGLQ